VLIPEVICAVDPAVRRNKTPSKKKAIANAPPKPTILDVPSGMQVKTNTHL